MSKKDSDTVKQLITGLEDIEVPQDEDIGSVKHQTMDALLLAEVYLKRTIEGNTSGGYWANLVQSRAEELADAFRDYVESLEEQEDEAEGSPEQVDSDSESPLEEWESAMEALLTLTPPIQLDATPELAKDYAVNIKRHVQSIADRTKAMQERLNSYETRQDSLEKKQGDIEESAESFFEDTESRLEAAESEILKDLRTTVETNHNRWYEEYREQSNSDFDTVKTGTEVAVASLLETTGEDLTKRVVDIEKSVKEARTNVEGVIERANGSFQEIRRRIEQENRKVSEQVEDQTKNLLLKLSKDVEYSGKIASALAGQVMSDGFKERSEKAETAARVGYGVVAVLIVLGAWYGSHVYQDLQVAQHTAVLAYTIVWRTLAFGAIGFAMYLAKNAIERYSAVADTNARLHLEMLALEPFVRGLNEEDEKKLRARVADMIFGHALVEDRQKLGDMLVKVFGKQQEEKSEAEEIEDLYDEESTIRSNGVNPEPTV